MRTPPHPMRRTVATSAGWLMALLLGVFALTGAASRQLVAPATGTASERIQHMWGETKALLLADSARPLTDADLVTLGTPLIESWTALESTLASAGETGEIHAVIKLLNDFYGRARSQPQRRMSIRTETRADLGAHIARLEARLRR